MLRPVVEHVVAMAPSYEVPRAVVGCVVISMVGGEDNPRHPYLAKHVARADLDADESASTVAPGRRISVPSPFIA